MAFISPLSPGAYWRLDRFAVVHPHEECMDVIVTGFEPVLLNLNTATDFSSPWFASCLYTVFSQLMAAFTQGAAMSVNKVSVIKAARRIDRNVVCPGAFTPKEGYGKSIDLILKELLPQGGTLQKCPSGATKNTLGDFRKPA